MTTARHPVAAHAARTDPGALIPAPSATGGRRVTLARAAALAANSRRSPKTRDDYAAIYRRFIAWLTDRLGGDPDLEDLTLEVLLAWRDHRRPAAAATGRAWPPPHCRWRWRPCGCWPATSACTSWRSAG
jgi:hypothetical protein